MKCVAVFQGALKGAVEFEQATAKSNLKITGKVEGLKKGEHGFHVHRLGDLRRDCANCADHWNPTKKAHGGLTGVSHAGDLGNIVANAKGEASIKITTNKLSLFGKRSILGRSIIIHADPDDLGKGNFPDSSTTGHSGKRLDCAVIGLAE